MKYYSLSFCSLLLVQAHAAYIPTERTAHRSSISWNRHSLIGQGPRQEHSVAAIDKDIYIIGGVAYNATSGLDTINRVEVCNVPKDTWHVAGPVPRTMNHLNAASVDGKIYVLGGLSGGKNWVAFSDSYVYDPYNDTWATIPGFPKGSARGSAAVGVFKSKVYLAGGMTILQPRQGGKQDSVTTVSSYDTITGEWNTAFPPLPEPRQHVGGVVVQSTFYVIGGRENGRYEYHNTTYALDLENPKSWKKLAPMPTARGGLACAALDHQIFCMGGEGNRDNPQQVFNETEAYDTKTNLWTKYPAMKVPRHRTGAATVGDAIYIPGGGVVTADFPVGITDSLHFL